MWLSAPLSLDRWPRVTSLYLDADLEVDLEAEESDGERERRALEVAPLLSLPLLGTPLAARQRITKLTISGSNADQYGIPAVALSSLAFLLPNLKELHLDGATLHRPDKSKPLGAHARQLHASLAAGAPRLEGLTLPDARWLEGVEALPGLKRIRVQPPWGSEDHGVLTPKAVVSLMDLRELEELEISGNDERSPERLDNSPLPMLLLLEALPESIKSFINGEGSYDGLDGLELTFQDGYVEKMSFRGCMGVLAEAAARLQRGDRMGPRLGELRLRCLRTPLSPVRDTTDLELETALRQLRGSCEKLQLDEITLPRNADMEPGLAATLQALELFGLPSALTVGVNVMLDLRLSCAALAAAAQQTAGPRSLSRSLWGVALLSTAAAGGSVASHQPPEPLALLRGAVERLIAEGKDAPMADSEGSSGEEMGVLVARGSFVDGLPQGDAGVLREGLRALLRHRGWRPRFAVQVVPTMSALLIKCANARIPAVKAALEEAQAEAQTQAQGLEEAQQQGGAQPALQQAPGGGLVLVQICNRSGRVPMCVNWSLQSRLEEAVQSALDAAAPHLSLVACLQWLHEVRQVLRELPEEVTL